MRIFLIILVGILLLSTACVEITEPPPPISIPEQGEPFPFSIGQWVNYQIKRYTKDSNEDDPQNLSGATIKISIVGKDIVKDQEYLWVEYLINENKEQQRVTKFMIDKEGIPQPIKLVTKYGKFQPVEIELRRWEARIWLTADTLLGEMIKGFNVIPFIRPIHSGEITEEEIQVNLGGKEIRLKCQKIILDEEEYGLEGSIWYILRSAEPIITESRMDIPLAGLVRAFFIEGNYRTFISLTDYGTIGAKSVITERPKKLDFKEEE